MDNTANWFTILGAIASCISAVVAVLLLFHVSKIEHRLSISEQRQDSPSASQSAAGTGNRQSIRQ